MKQPRVHLVAHLEEVLHRQVRQSVRVLLARPLVGDERRLQIVRLRAQALVEHDAVLERRVRPLPVERHDGVRRVAQKHDPVAMMPRPAADRHERGRWVAKKSLASVGMSGTASGKTSPK